MSILKSLVSILFVMIFLSFTNASQAGGIKFDNLPMSTPETALIELANHSSDGVLERTFNGVGRCSAVCPVMQDIGAAHCSSIGRCWCDEKDFFSKGITIGYPVCN